MAHTKGEKTPLDGGAETPAKLHAGHRQRVRENFLASGLDAFQDVNALELLLFYAVPYRDTNPLAHQLLRSFGSLAGVFDAPVEELQRVGGLTENAAALIKLVPAMTRRYQMNRAELENILDTTRKCGAYLIPFFLGETDEVVYLLGLDAKCKALNCVRLFQGSVNSAGISIRRVVESALNMRATSVVLAHNHTSGIAVPSREDVATTELVQHALELVGVLLADHIIVADGDFVSLAESGLIERQV